jgi:hypothetical protein
MAWNNIYKSILIDMCRAAAAKDDKIIPIEKFATNPEIDVSSGAVDVWNYTGGDLVRLNSAEYLLLQSSSAADTMDVLIFGLDADYNLISELVTLTGTTVVQTTIKFLRVYRAQVAEYSTAANAGNITIAANTSGTVQAYINAENGQTQMSHMTIPAGYTGFLFQIEARTSMGDDALAYFNRATGDGTYIVKSVAEINEATPPYPFGLFPAPIPEKSDIKIQAEAKTNNTRLVVNYTLLLMSNDYLAV